MIMSLFRASLRETSVVFQKSMNRYLAANRFHTVSVAGGSIGMMVVALDQDPPAIAGGSDTTHQARGIGSQKIIESRCQRLDAAAARDRHLSSSTPRMRSHRIMTTTLNRPTGAANVNTREPSGG